MDSVRLQWLLIALGALAVAALSAWLVWVGTWWLVVALIAVSGHSGYVAWREGLPLLPGSQPRGD